jgi:hypothetical protein
LHHHDPAIRATRHPDPHLDEGGVEEQPEVGGAALDRRLGRLHGGPLAEVLSHTSPADSLRREALGYRAAPSGAMGEAPALRELRRPALGQFRERRIVPMRR